MPASIAQQQLLSEEVQEIINYKPGWVIRKGNIVFLIILLLLLGLSFIIRYPDVVKASVRIAAMDAPKALLTKTEGRLEKLLAANGEQVKKGQPLAWIQNTAKHEQVSSLQQWIDATEPAVEAGDMKILLAKPLPLLSELGELQPAYQDFQNTLKETVETLPDGYYQKKKQALAKDIEYQRQIEQNLQNQNMLQQQDYALQKKEYVVNQQLADEKVIAPIELDREKSKLLNKEQSLKQMSSQLISSDIAKHNKTKDLLDLQKYLTDQEQKFQSAFLNLKNSIEEWKQKYIIVSPADGRLEYLSFVQENQLLQSGQELFFIQPPGNKYYAEMKAGQNNLGKIRNGQKVLIRLESYPSNEFGYITGTISYISNMPSERDSFLVKVELPDGLKTNYNKEIFFRNNLSASAEIITDNRVLAERLLGQLGRISKK